MAKENVAKFFEKLANDKVLAEKLAAADKAYAEKHKGEDAEVTARKTAAEAIILPLAKETGLPFTVEELAAYEQERQGQIEGEVSDDEMANAAGGGRKNLTKGETRTHMGACYYVGVGIGKVSDGKDTAMCIVIGGSTGPIAATEDK